MPGIKKRASDLARLEQDEELQGRVVELLEAGKSMVVVWRETGLCRGAVDRWIEQNPSRAGQARVRAAHALVDEALEIADNLAPREVQHADGTTSVVIPSGDEVRAAKLRVDVRQWTAERWNRAAYGQKVEVSGQVNVQHLHLSALQRRHRASEAQQVTDVEARMLGEAVARGEAYAEALEADLAQQLADL